MLKAFKYRIYPNKEQKSQMSQTFGCVRFVYNYFLSMRTQEYRMEQLSISYTACAKELTLLKSDPDFAWLKDVDSTALQSALKELDDAFKNFFSKRAGYPRFRLKKFRKDSYTAKCNNDSISLMERVVKLPKLGFVKTKVSRPCEGKIMSATVSRAPSGKYFVSILCETADSAPLPKTGRTIGIDLGIYATLSDGMEISNPKYLNDALKQFAHEQKALSRKQKGSGRWEKQRVKVARIHERVTNIKNDFLQKLSTMLVNTYDAIFFEDLSVSGMLKDKCLARYISGAGWRKLIRMTMYKAKWYGKTVQCVGQYFVSSQKCSMCGSINPEVKDLSVREWTCPECGTHHNRGWNASVNIETEGLRLLASV